MKKLFIATVIVGSTIAVSPVANATPDLCAGQMDQKEAAFGFHPGEKSIPGCEGDSGPDYANNSQTPDAVPHPDARLPLSPKGNVDSGSYDELTDIQDDDGYQADEVRKSPVYVPGGVS